MNARLKDEFGGRIIYVRGDLKIKAHLIGIIALTARSTHPTDSVATPSSFSLFFRALEDAIGEVISIA